MNAMELTCFLVGLFGFTIGFVIAFAIGVNQGAKYAVKRITEEL